MFIIVYLVVVPGVIQAGENAIRCRWTIITLFEKADSSTLIHEIAHYCFNSMEEAIRDDDIWLKLFITGNIFTKNKQK